jgi:hypothetical protein
MRALFRQAAIANEGAILHQSLEQPATVRGGRALGEPSDVRVRMEGRLTDREHCGSPARSRLRREIAAVI